MKRKLLACWLVLCCAVLGQTAMAQTALEDGSRYYLLNKETQLFIGESESLVGFNAMLFTVEANEQGIAFKNSKDQYLNLTVTANDGLFGGASPKSVTVSAAGAATYFDVTEESGVYNFSTTKTWKYGLTNRNSSYTAYLTCTAADGATTLSTNTEADVNAAWTLVTEKQYTSGDMAKNVAKARLAAAIAAAEEALELEAPSVASETPLRIALASAKVTLGSFLSGTNSYNNSAASLEAATAKQIALSEPYIAYKAEVENIRAMGGMDVACGTATIALDAAGSESAMSTAMDILYVAALSRVSLKNLVNKPLNDNTNLTGLIRNNSFDLGTMKGWYTLKVNAGEAASAIGNIINGAISGGGNAGSLAGLINAISISDFDETSHPVVNGGTMINGHNKYYYQTNSGGLLSSGQMIFVPLIGLPEGTYKASALMCENFGLDILNTSHLTAIVVPANTGILGEIIGNIDITDITNVNNILKGVMGSLGEIISQGSIKSGTGNASKKNEFVDVSVDFEVEDGALVILALDAGIAPLIGTAPFKADNVRLTYVQSFQSAKQQMSSALAAADVPDANLATRASNDNPFTYNTNLVNQYQKAVDAANAVATSDTRSTKEIADAAKKLADFQATFFDKAFQGPTAAGLFNINMLDENATSCVGKSATFGETNIAFTELAGETNYLQTVSFEKTGDAVNTYYLTVTLADGSKAYLTGNTTLSTTTDQSKATVYSVVPSTHVESANAIKNGNTAIGVAKNSNVLTSSSVLYNALSVTPAKKHDVVLNVSSVGWSTFMLPYDGVLPKGFVAYRATGVEDNLVVDIDEVEELEACVPYLVRHTDSEGNLTAGTYTFSDYARATSKMHKDGLLTGSFERTEIDANANNYVLQNNNGRLGFYAVDSKGIFVGANRAYLTDETHGQLVKAMSGIFGDEATAIEGIHQADNKAEVYDLSGRRVQKPTHGIYIVNGKKVLK